MKREDLLVTIPVPCEIPKARGIWATHQFGAIINTRVHVDERELIEQEAGALGISKAAFMRWCAVKVAEALRQRRKDNAEGTSTAQSS